METNDHLLATIERVGDLPAMPEAVADVLRLTEDVNASMDEIAGAVGRDPALTARLLRISNSPYYGMRQYVGTVQLALVILGMREIRNIVLGVSLFDSIRSDEASGVVAQDFWDHSFQVASICRRLAQSMKLQLQGEEFVAGLLHDIGKLILARTDAAAYNVALTKTGGHGDALCKAELAAFGFTHADAAAALAVRWNLPKTLTDALWLHHDKADASIDDAKDPQLAAVVCIANVSARTDFASEDAVNALVTNPAWDTLHSAPDPIHESAREEALREICAEIDEEAAPTFD